MICFDRSQGQDFSSLPNKQGRALDRRALSIEIESVSLAAQLRGLLIPSADIHSETEDLPAFETHNMAQKSLFKNKKNPAQKAVAANRHGKIAKTKKGNLSAPPKKANLLKAYTDNKALTTAINKRNEKAAVGQAAQAGGRLKSMQPPVNGTADQKQKAKSSSLASR